MNKDYQLRLLRASYNGLAGIKASALDGGRSNEATAIGKVQDCIEQVVNSLDEPEEPVVKSKHPSEWDIHDEVECTQGIYKGLRGKINGFYRRSCGEAEVKVVFGDDMWCFTTVSKVKWISRPVDDGY